MTAHPDLSGIYVTPLARLAQPTAVEDAGKTGQVKVISFDFVDETMESSRRCHLCHGSAPGRSWQR